MIPNGYLMFEDENFIESSVAKLNALRKSGQFCDVRLQVLKLNLLSFVPKKVNFKKAINWTFPSKQAFNEMSRLALRFYFSFICMVFCLCVCMSLLYMYSAQGGEKRRGCRIPRNWNYRWLWAIVWVLVLRKSSQCALNCWDIFPAVRWFFF